MCLKFIIGRLKLKLTNNQVKIEIFFDKDSQW